MDTEISSAPTLGVLKYVLTNLGAIVSAKFSPDQNYILLWCKDHVLRVFDTHSGELKSWWEHEDTIEEAVFSPDSHHIASCSHDHYVRVIDTSSQTLIHQWEHESSVVGVAFSPDNRRLATCCDDRTVHLYDLSQGQRLHQWTHEYNVGHVVFSYDSKLLAAVTGYIPPPQMYVAQLQRLLQNPSPQSHTLYISSSENHKSYPNNQDKYNNPSYPIRLYDVSSGQILQTLSHSSEVSSVAFSEDSQYLVTASAMQTRTFHIHNGHMSSLHEHDYFIQNISFSSDYQYLLTKGPHALSVYPCKIPHSCHTPLYTLNLSSEIRCSTFSPNAQYLIVESEHDVRLYQTSNGKLLSLWKHDHYIRSVVFSPDSNQLLVLIGRSQVMLYDVYSKSLLQRWDYQDYVTEVKFSPEGTAVLIGTAHGTRVYDAKTEDFIHHIPSPPPTKSLQQHSEQKNIDFYQRMHQEKLNRQEIPFINLRLYGWTYGQRTSTVSFSCDGTLVGIGRKGGGLDGKGELVCVYQVLTGRLLKYWEFTEEVLEVIFSGDNRFVVVRLGCGEMVLYEVQSGELKYRWTERVRLGRSIFSKDSRYIVSLEADAMWKVKLYSVDRGDVVRVWEQHERIRDLRFSDDGEYLLVWSEGEWDDGESLWVYDGTQGGRRCLWSCQLGELYESFFILNGVRVFVCCGEGIIVFDTTTGKELRRWSCNSLDRLCVCGEGYVLLSTRQGKVCVYENCTGKLLHFWDQGCRVGVLKFSTDEEYVGVGGCDGSIRIYKRQQGGLLYEWTHATEVTSIDFSTDGKFVATGSKDQSVRMYDLVSGEEVFCGSYGESITKVIFSPDAQEVLTVDYREVRLFQTSIRKED